MSLKISGGIEENGIVVGNVYDKYGSNNPIVKWIMQGFESALSDFVIKSSPKSIHEIGCGEGYWVIRWIENEIPARGCDFSEKAVALARENALERGHSPDLFKVRSIYDVKSEKDSADLIVCCEVLEHLEDPKSALKALQRIVKRNLIVSVPREPIWRCMNLIRGKYVKDFGNTPGHINHWSKSNFIRLVSMYFDIVRITTPFPWTMLLCQPHSGLAKT